MISRENNQLKATSPNKFCKHELFTADGRRSHLLVISGTYYDMGFYIGYELAQLFHQDLEKAYASTKRKISIILNKRRDIDKIINHALEKFESKIPIECQMEMLGVYDGCREAGLPIKDEIIFEKFICMIELGEQACTLFAAQPPMTTGHTYQLRDLDYYRNINMNYIPIALIRIPQNNNGEFIDSAYAAFDFISNICGGVLTGVNEHGVAFSHSRAAFKKRFSYDGIPVKCLIQQILSKSKTALDGASYIKKHMAATSQFTIISDPLQTKESLQLIFAGPDLFNSVTYDQSPDLSIIEYPNPNLRFYERMNGIVYWTDMIDRRVNEILTDFNMDDFYYYLKPFVNKLDTNSILEIAKRVGNDITMISAFYDTTTSEAWVAYSDKNKPAHTNEFVYFDLKKYFNYKKERNNKNN